MSRPPFPQRRNDCGLAVAVLILLMTGAGRVAAAPGEVAPQTQTTYSEAKVRAMWIKHTPVPLGGTSPFTVRVSTNQSGDAAVGLIEHILGSAGDAWKSSAWIAALAASNTSDHLLTDHEFLVKVRGFIDGPSAGMLMAATMLALINQDPVRPDVTITGTVNPDGTIGPVSGIQYKIGGAKKDGIKEIGYPLIDEGDEGELIRTMEKLGAEHGIKTVPVADLYQAYELLTGRKLGRPLPLDAAELSFSPEFATKVGESAQTLLGETRARLAACAAATEKLSAKLLPEKRKSLASDRALTETYVSEAEAYAKDGAVMMAHNRAMRADQSSRMSEKFLEWQQAEVRRDMKELESIYDAQFTSAGAKLDAMAAALQTGLQAPTLAGRISGFHSYLQYWDARAQLLAASAGRDELGRKRQAFEQARTAKPKVSEVELSRLAAEIVESMRDTTLRLTILEGRVHAAGGLARIQQTESTTPAPDLTALNRQLAEAYGPAAAAGLAYFESTVIRGRSGTPDGAAGEAAARKGAILSNDIAYGACSRAAEHSIRTSETAAGDDEPPASVVDRLACGVYSYLGMAGLMNKYYNLAEDTDNGGAVTHSTTVTLRKGNTVNRMIESSRRRVLEEAAVVKRQLQFIPDSVKMNFSLGETKRSENTDVAKLDALTSYWRAHFLCKLAQMMARAK